MQWDISFVMLSCMAIFYRMAELASLSVILYFYLSFERFDP